MEPNLLDPAFRDWNIEALLPAISCPILGTQGVDDEYGTMEQIESIARAVPITRLLPLAACGHSPHRDQPQAVLAASKEFVTRAQVTGEGKFTADAVGAATDCGNADHGSARANRTVKSIQRD